MSTCYYMSTTLCVHGHNIWQNRSRLFRNMAPDSRKNDEIYIVWSLSETVPIHLSPNIWMCMFWDSLHSSSCNISFVMMKCIVTRIVCTKFNCECTINSLICCFNRWFILFIVEIFSRSLLQSVDYFRRQLCSSCLNISECAWCENLRTCLPFSDYVSRYRHGQCTEWMDSEISKSNNPYTCRNCSLLKTCDKCLKTFSCGWCGNSVNPTIGVCFEGDFAGM